MNELLTHVTSLDSKDGDMLDLVVKLANQNSGSFHIAGIEKVQQMLIQEFNSLEGELSLLPGGVMAAIDDSGEPVGAPLGPSIHIRKRPDAKRKVLLCIHMDTVYEPDHSFQTCRTLANGHVNGPGVADAKGGLVVMLEALRTFEASPLADQLGWEVLINSDEEVGSHGSIQTMREIAKRCDFGLLFEPSLDERHLVSWRKGSGSFTFVVRGRAAHAGRHFHEGRNAVVAASQLASEIDKLNTSEDVTYNVGRITGGRALNVVPELAIVRINVRVKTVQQQNDVEVGLAELVTQFNKLDGISVDHSGGFLSPPKPITPELSQLQQRIETCADMLGQPVQWMGTGGTCDGNKFAAAGLPNVDSLGPSGGRIHSDEEFLIPESLVSKAKLAAMILLSYAKEA